jgi:hypothetical protein
MTMIPGRLWGTWVDGLYPQGEQLSYIDIVRGALFYIFIKIMH